MNFIEGTIFYLFVNFKLIQIKFSLMFTSFSFGIFCKLNSIDWYFG